MFLNPLDNRSLYHWYDLSMRTMQPYSMYCLDLARSFRRIADTVDLPIHLPYASRLQKKGFARLQKSSIQDARALAAYFYVIHLCTNIYTKPTFGISDIKIDGEFYEVQEEIIDKKSFCHLLHFKKMNIQEGVFPKLLMVAPMAGHYATLLRNTVKYLLPHYDIYITDWKNARDVPLIDGSFDLNTYVDYIISFFRQLSPALHVMAVCQATVPVLTALAILSTKKDTRIPKTAILLGGPIDTTQSPTIVDELATSRGDDWFQQNVISMVPTHFPGGMRLVYPGFMQLSGFLGMNLQRHIESLQRAIHDYANNKKKSAMKTIQFYLEYFSTMDLTAEFYMQTIHTVFQQQLLVKGKFKSKGRMIRLQDITEVAMLAIEGEKDDITGIGQTKSVIKLCKNLPDHMKEYFLAEGVGHYGLFNGSKFRRIIIPEINAFVDSHR